MRLHCSILLLNGLFKGLAPGQVAPTFSDTIALRYQLLGANCALFPAAARFPDWRPEKKLSLLRRFTPTAPQVAATEKALTAVQLLHINPGPKTSQDSTYARAINQRFAQYHRQYFGFYNRHKEPCVFINFISDYPFTPEETGLRPKPATYVPYWLSRYVFLADGGNDHWSVYYNLATGKFYQYWHNLDLGGG